MEAQQNLRGPPKIEGGRFRPQVGNVLNCEADHTPSTHPRLTFDSPPPTLHSPVPRVGVGKSGVRGMSEKRARCRKLFYFAAKT
jgi:hypothetical protein